MKELNFYLGKRIREYREQRNYTQDYMSNKLNISTNHYGRIERGENACTIANLVKLSQILNISPNDLFRGIINIENDNFFELYEKLNKKDKEFVKNICKLIIKN